MTQQYNHDIEARSKKQEARSKKQEARSKKQEARSKKQEARSVEVYVVTHKKIDFALPDYCKKAQVNAENTGMWEGYLHDNDNPDNISLKNPSYAELSSLYSVWKNCKADIQGLFHYRRFIGESDIMLDEYGRQQVISYSDILKTTISRETILKIFETEDIILTFPVGNDFWNIAEFAKGSCGWENTRELCKIIGQYYPDYLPSLSAVFKMHTFCTQNLFIAKREVIDGYCTWLFDVLEKLEKHTPFEEYQASGFRLYAYFAEYLINVYVHRHNLRCKYFIRNFCDVNSTRRILKKFPAIVKAVRLMRNRKYRKIKALEDFLHSWRNHGDVVRYAVSLGAEDIGDFLCLKSKFNHYFNIKIMDFIPKHEDNFLQSFMEIIGLQRQEAAKEDTALLPRIALSSKVPETTKETLWEAGVRILEYF